MLVLPQLWTHTKSTLGTRKDPAGRGRSRAEAAYVASFRDGHGAEHRGAFSGPSAVGIRGGASSRTTPNRLTGVYVGPVLARGGSNGGPSQTRRRICTGTDAAPTLPYAFRHVSTTSP